MKYRITMDFTSDELTSFYFAAASARSRCQQRKDSGNPLPDDEMHMRVFQRMFNAQIRRVENDQT